MIEYEIVTESKECKQLEEPAVELEAEGGNRIRKAVPTILQSKYFCNHFESR